MNRRPTGMSHGNDMTFWTHLDALRSVLIRIAAATAVCSVAAFFFKDELFAVILAPKEPSFFTYRLFPEAEAFSVELINTGLTGQFVTHMKVSLWAGLLCASPYVIYQLFRFVSPALYANERRYSLRVVLFGYALFVLGVSLCYFLIFPLTFCFLGTYQVSGEVENMVSLQSYVSTLLTLSLAMGAVFEIPVLSWFLAKLGIADARRMRHYRRHAIVAILVIAAVITPTADIFTLLLVALPIWLLYEASIWVVALTARKNKSLSSKQLKETYLQI